MSAQGWVVLDEDGTAMMADKDGILWRSCTRPKLAGRAQRGPTVFASKVEADEAITRTLRAPPLRYRQRIAEWTVSEFS